MPSHLSWAFLLKTAMSKLFAALLICWIVLPQTLSGQDRQERLQATFDFFVKAVMLEDAAAIVRLTPDYTVEMIGGKDYLTLDINTEWAMYKELGLQLTTIHVVETSEIVAQENTQQCLLTYRAKYKSPSQDVEEQSYLLAISADEGQNWKLLDLKKYDKESIGKFLPIFDVRLLAYWP